MGSSRWLLCVMAALTVGAPAAHADPLVGQWHLDEQTANSTPDSSGHGADVAASAPSTLVAGRFGSAFDLGGAAGRILRTAAPVPALQPARVTLLAWVKHSGYPGVLRYLAGQGANNTCNFASYAMYT